MKNYILSCTHCGKMYKGIEKYIDSYITDFGDKINNCIYCGSELQVKITEDWVAEKVFTLKGEKVS